MRTWWGEWVTEAMMETKRFDDLAKHLARQRSRRQVVKGLLGSVLGLGVAGALVRTSAAVECLDQGEACVENEDCCQGYYCNDDNVCSSAPECVSASGGCDADEACCGNLVCLDNRTCGCEVNTDCGAQEECDAGLCVGVTSGPECLEDSDCDEAADEICCGGVCAAIACCTDDDDPNARCPEGTSCFEGSCDPVGSQTDGEVSALPNTGVGGPAAGSSIGWLRAAALAVSGAVALGAASRRERATSEK